MTSIELKSRTKQFALRVLKLVNAIPPGRAGNVVASQLGRSGTSVGANYRAACKARSQAEFVSKIGVVEEESDESGFWLEITIEASLMTAVKVMPLLTEANELTAIMGASRITAAKKIRAKTNRQSAIGNRQ